MRRTGFIFRSTVVLGTVVKQYYHVGHLKAQISFLGQGLAT